MEAKDYSIGAKYIPILETADNEYKEVAWGKSDFNKPFEPMLVNRPKVGEHDVKIDMLYCGICHSDLHLACNHLGTTMYPIVPGHELIGRVDELGEAVAGLKVGDIVGVGCISDACLDCRMCKRGDEQYCCKGKSVHTYNDRKRYNHIGGN